MDANKPKDAAEALDVSSGSASGGPEIWNVVAWGDVRECHSVSSVMEEVREAVELGCRTISIERQGAPNTKTCRDCGATDHE